MATTPEGKVKSRITAHLKRLGAYYFYPATGGFGRSGVPDIVGCFHGHFFAIECKAGKNKPTRLQEKELGKIRGSSGAAWVINEEGVDDVPRLLHNLIHKEKPNDA